MAVSKIAVIALVAIVAVPILLGYAMNIQQVEEHDYITTGEVTNVTPLLQNGTGHSYANADSYKINSQFGHNVSGSSVPNMLPIFENLTFTKSSMRYQDYYWDSGGHPGWGGPAGIPLSSWVKVYYESYDEGAGPTLTVYYRDPDGNLIRQIDNFHSFYYDSSTMQLECSYYSGSSLVSYKTIVPATNYKIGISNPAGYVGKGYAIQNLTSTTTYADITAGYHFLDSSGYVELTHYTKQVLFTINLDSITDPNYEISFFNDYVKLQKTTTDGVVSWKAIRYGGLIQHDLYYESTRSDNTYQIAIDIEKIGPDSNRPGYDYYHFNVEYRYVGSWPLIGAANVYSTYTYYGEFWYDTQYGDYYYIDNIPFSHNGSRTPTIRVDNALFRAFSYPVIEDQSYDPAALKSNPVTTITDVTRYGISLEFGGNTYTVNNGNITLESRQIPVNGLSLLSTPNPNGGYDNKIGNTLISTTAQPSTIKFNGQWAASISTVAQQSHTYTSNEWTAGEFSWDGMDQNFLMVGLITCLGVFVALGIYARRKGSGGLIPLMVAVGCAAMVFFIML